MCFPVDVTTRIPAANVAAAGDKETKGIQELRHTHQGRRPQQPPEGGINQDNNALHGIKVESFGD
jgi:hypothetical protein